MGGTYFIRLSNYSPFFEKGFTGVLQGCPIAYFATIGFDSAACYSKETKNPNKNIPLAIVISITFSAFIYVSLSFVLTGMADIQDVPEADALGGIAWAFKQNGSGVISLIVSIGALVGLTCTTFVCLLSQPRVFMSISEDGLLCKLFQKMNPKTNVLTASSLITGVGAMLFAGLFKFKYLASSISLACLFGYGVVSVGIITNRYRESAKPLLRTSYILVFIVLSIICGFAFSSSWDCKYIVILACMILLVGICIHFGTFQQTCIPTKYACPLVPMVPMISIFANFFMFGTVDFLSWMITIVFFVIGGLMYFTYGIRNSKLGKERLIAITTNKIE